MKAIKMGLVTCLLVTFGLMDGYAQDKITSKGWGSEFLDSLMAIDTTTKEGPSLRLDNSRSRKKNVETRYITFELGMDVWLPSEDYRIAGNIDPMEQRLANSTNVNLYIMRQRFNLIKHQLNLEYGVGLNFHKIMFDNPVVMVREEGEMRFEYRPDDGIRKSRLNSTYLTIPLLLNFESNPNQSRNSFRIAAGVYGSTRLGSNFKQKFSSKNAKDRDSFSLSPFRWGFAGQIGYGPVNLFVNYSMTDVFESNKTDQNYEIGMISAGFIIIPF